MLADPSKPVPAVSDADRKEDGRFVVHAGLSEMSRLLFLRNDLIPLTFLKARSYTANNMAEVVTHGKTTDWPGYIGAPRLATASFGARAMRHDADEFNRLALAILDGLDERTLPRLSVLGYQDKATAQVLSNAAKHWAAIENKQAEWLKRNKALME